MRSVGAHEVVDSGKTNRQRLNPAGDRQANSAR
jgi:hypothetical protein